MAGLRVYGETASCPLSQDPVLMCPCLIIVFLSPDYLVGQIKNLSWGQMQTSDCTIIVKQGVLRANQRHWKPLRSKKTSCWPCQTSQAFTTRKSPLLERRCFFSSKSSVLITGETERKSVNPFVKLVVGDLQVWNYGVQLFAAPTSLYQLGLGGNAGQTVHKRNIMRFSHVFLKQIIKKQPLNFRWGHIAENKAVKNPGTSFYILQLYHIFCTGKLSCRDSYPCFSLRQSSHDSLSQTH